MNNRIPLIISIVALLLAAAAFSSYFFVFSKQDRWVCQDSKWVKKGEPTTPAPLSGCGGAIVDFDDCAKVGYAVMESYPRQCKTADGRTFKEDIGNEMEKTNLIRAIRPRPNTTISSPLSIAGEARGTWFFEATFPIELVGSDGQTIARSYATAIGEWMTVDFVPFTAMLNFTKPEGMENGTLILHKDNPSGLPENDDLLEIPIKF